MRRTILILSALLLIAAMATPADAAPAVAGVADVVAFGADATGARSACPAFTAAIATGAPVHVPPGRFVLADCYLTLVADGQGLTGEGRGASRVQFTYSGPPKGPAITIGGEAAQTRDVTVRGIGFIDFTAGQSLFWTRWARAVRFTDISAKCDQFLRLGDETLGPDRPTYIVEFYEGDELSQNAHPTMHFVEERNFRGQLVMNDAFVEGNAVTAADPARVDGWHGGGNIQAPDHAVIRGGYFGRFNINWNFYGERVANYYFDSHHSEGALVSALKAGQAAGAARSGGFNQMLITNSLFDARGDAMVFQCDRAGDLCDRLQISGVALGGSSRATGGGIVLATNGATVQQVNIVGVTAVLDPPDAGGDAVRLVGAGKGVLRDITIDGVNARSANANALRAVVRIEGASDSDIEVGGRIVGRNAATLVDDLTGVTRRK